MWLYNVKSIRSQLTQVLSSNYIKTYLFHKENSTELLAGSCRHNEVGDIDLESWESLYLVKIRILTYGNEDEEFLSCSKSILNTLSEEKIS